uniref:Aminopeptidase N n=1 Tax=Panagrolaimus sp. ES5 TaxID=591445 RepID=A0AC34GSU2_9BILA
MDVIKPTSTIILNSHELLLNPKNFLVSVIHYSNALNETSINILGMTESPESEAIILKLDREVLPNQKVFLRVKYSGKIGINSERGFYKSEKDGDIVYTTMFQTKGARAVFPCFDEPEYKAEFKIEIAKPKSWIALSNAMEEYTKYNGDGYDWVSFKVTEKISTYMVAFAIGDLVKLEGKTADGILTRIWTFRSGERRMKTGLESAIKCTDAMTNYTSFPLKLQKMDHLAIPEKHFFAMENPGLVIYDQRVLLLDDGEDISYSNPKGYNQWYRVSSVICHEMAHQWFGNLLTNKWWGDSWLHEGFANYFENYAFSKAFPNEKGIIDIRAASIILDKIINYPGHEFVDHPIITKNGEFDQVTYNKGGAILRQLEAVISPEVFQKAIQRYIKTFAYSNVNSKDFIQKIQESVDETDLKDWCGESFNVTSFMNLWLNEIGIPYLNIDYVNGTFEITQTDIHNRVKASWPLPLFVQYENDKTEMIWLAPDYLCADGTKLPATKSIKTFALFINPDLLSLTEMIYNPKSSEAVYKALLSNKNFQLSPASIAVFYEQVKYYLFNYKNIPYQILNHQKSAKIYDISENLNMYG